MITTPMKQKGIFSFSSVQFSCSVMSDSLWSHRPQHSRPPCLPPTPKACSNSCSLSWRRHPSHPLSSPSPPALNLSQNQDLFQWVSSSHQVAKVLEFQLKRQSFEWIFRTDYHSVQSLSCVWLSATPWTAACQASLSITNSQSLPKLMYIELVMPSNHLILCRPLLLPWIFPSIRVFSNESVLRIRWPKDWSFRFSISPSNEHSGLISFRMDWLDLLVVQGTLKSLLQHHSSNASILQYSALFMIQLSHPYMTTGKTIALTRRTFVSKVMSLLFNMLSRLVIAFLPRRIF